MLYVYFALYANVIRGEQLSEIRWRTFDQYTRRGGGGVLAVRRPMGGEPTEEVRALRRFSVSAAASFMLAARRPSL